MSGGSGGATVTATAPQGRDAALQLSETGGEMFSIANQGASNRLVVSNAGTHLLTIDSASNGSSRQRDGCQSNSVRDLLQLPQSCLCRPFASRISFIPIWTHTELLRLYGYGWVCGVH